MTVAFGEEKAVCADASTNAGGGAVETTSAAPPSGNSTLAPAPLPGTHRGGRESTRRHERTHKYCLFLACLAAARVWSLLKSPESDSKMSSIRIPARALHMSPLTAWTHAAVLGADVLPAGSKRVTSSGSAPRLIVAPRVRAAVGTDTLAEKSAGGKGDEPRLNGGSQKCYMYGQV